MMTTHETPSQPIEDDPDHRRQIAAHLFDIWAFEHVDTAALTVEEIEKDTELAHNDLHRDEE